MCERPAIRHVERVMGTVFSFDIRVPGQDGAAPAAHAPAVTAALERATGWLHHVDAVFSTYRPGSQISRLARGEITVAGCDPEVAEVLDRCETMAAATAGRFSVAPRGRLDPSGLVKGWAIERASALLTEAGLPDHHINGGGDVQLCGGPAPGEPWRVGLADPLEPGELITVVSGRDLAVATSGTAERGRHIIDARTGRAATALASITLVGRHLTDVDALATAAFVMGADARAWAEAWPGIEALAVTRDHSAWRTSGFERFTTRDGLDLLPG